MAIISAGYDGTIDEIQFAGMLPKAGASEYGVAHGGSLAVTAVAGQDRTVSIAPGTCWGHSVVDTVNANETRALAAPASGSRWDMIVLRRDWQPPGGATTIEVIQGGPSNTTLPPRENRPGVTDEQPIALVRVDAGSTTVGAIIDLRVWARNGGATANSDLVLQYLNAAGTVIEINGVVYRVKQASTVIDTYLDEVGAQPYRHFQKYTQTSISNEGNYLTLTGFTVGPGDQGDNTGLSYNAGVVTVARSGIYDLAGSVHYLGGISADKFAAFLVDGTRYRAKLNGATGSVHVYRQLYISAGAKVALQAWQNSGGNLTIPSDADTTYWTIRRIGR